jgi:ribosomal protein S26
MKKLFRKNLFLSCVIILALFFVGCPNPNSGDSAPPKYEYHSKYYITNITYAGDWTLQSDGSHRSPSISSGSTTKMRVNFTSTVDNASITILLQASIYSGYENSDAYSGAYSGHVFISTLDNASATYNSGYYSGSRISKRTSVPVTIPVPEAGDHFIDIGYRQYGTGTYYSNCAWFTVIPIGSGEILNDNISGVSYVGNWTLQGDGSRQSPSISSYSTTKSRIFFTSTVDNASITILLKASIYSGYAFVEGKSISGNTSVPVTIPVPKAGDHFIDISYYQGDIIGSSGSYLHCAWYTLVP